MILSFRYFNTTTERRTRRHSRARRNTHTRHELSSVATKHLEHKNNPRDTQGARCRNSVASCYIVYCRSNRRQIIWSAPNSSRELQGPLTKITKHFETSTPRIVDTPGKTSKRSHPSLKVLHPEYIQWSRPSPITFDHP